MEQNRPVYISVTKYKFPITAIMSILHRISGFVLFLFLPLLLYILSESLLSSSSFMMTKDLLAEPVIIWLLWMAIAALIFHFFAGIRHLMMDIGWFESLIAGRITAYVVFVLFLVGIILAGVWLW